jgi:hypothetical protein
MSSTTTRQKMIKASEAQATAVRAEVLEDASERIVAYLSESAERWPTRPAPPFMEEFDYSIFHNVFWGLKNAWGSAYPDDDVVEDAFNSLAEAGRIWTAHDGRVRLRG